ncbi:MAPEG family protein [Methylosinus sp. Sm6]|uniref:MAPEG family protein n=1 Tax=Methylosinus sp. Sm6 TaxID=2866948 RepID=UPI001C99E71C|nr:MAPEG family protein [Methylosinus sp. Sm6]MBY6240610.1 MAPEG family protein [Methylosinus sp. Sm6]
MRHSPLLAPIVALVLWTFVMWAWLYATRIPAMRKARMALDPEQTKEEFNAQIPARARWKADNYNHLHEQPTLFYAVALTLAMLGADGALETALAWGYVALRVAHSLVQSTTNVMIRRFSIFVAASLVLLALTIRAAVLVF